MSDGVDLNVKGLEQLLKALKAKPPEARVGILGGKASRGQDKKAGPNNATIGAFHEFGTTELPVRSFLRIPISENLQKEMEKSGAFDPKTLEDVIKQGSVIPWMLKITSLAEGIVLDAFDTGGFGAWKPSVMTNKKNHQTLVETHQLRDSITSEVK